MADFNSAQKIDLTPQALAMIRLIQAGQSTTSESRFDGRFGPGFPPMPVEPETEPRLFQYMPGINLMMVPRMGYNVLPFATLRAMASACKEIRLNIEHIKRTMRGVEWDIVPNDKRKTVVGGKTYVATPEKESIKKFFKRPDGINNFESWLNMVLEEILVTDALTLWPVQEIGTGDLQAVELVDGTTIKPLVDMRGATPRPPIPAYLQIIYGTPSSSYPANTMFYRPLNTKVNTPYGESAIEWILTAINTAIRKDLSAVGYYAEGNIPGAFYTVPESWTPEQIETFQNYIDALMAGDLARAAKLLAVPGGSGSHVTQFQQNDPDNINVNEYLMKVACWAYGNSPAEFGITSGAGLGGAGFMEGSENTQQRSMIGPVSGFLESIFTEIIHDWLHRPDLRFSFVGLEPIEDTATQATADQANINMGVYTVAYIQDRDAVPQEYRPSIAPQGFGGGALPVPLPAGYERYLKAALTAALDSELGKWQEKSLRALKKGWGVADFKSDVLPPDLIESVHSRLTVLHESGEMNESSIKDVFVSALEKHHGPGNHKSGSSQSVHGGGGAKNNSIKYKVGDVILPMGRMEYRSRVVSIENGEYVMQYETRDGQIGKTERKPVDYVDGVAGTIKEVVIPSSVQKAKDEYDFQSHALKNGGYGYLPNEADPKQMREIRANHRRAAERLVNLANEYKQDGWEIPDEYLNLKYLGISDLEKFELSKGGNVRMEAERELQGELVDYFSGLADRIASAVVEIDSAGGELSFGKREFSSDEERRAAFAHMRENGTFNPSFHGKDGPDQKGKEPAGITPAGSKFSEAFTSITGKQSKKVIEAISAIDKVHGVGSMPKIPIDGNAGRNYGQYKSYTNGSPIGISVASHNSDHPMMTTAHEIGHYLDHKGFEGKTWASNSEELSGILSASKKSETINGILSGSFDKIPVTIKGMDGDVETFMSLTPRMKQYYLKDKEVFARAYSQYITIRSKNPNMMSELRKQQNGQHSYVVWQDDEFKPIAAEFDKLFKSKGWLK